MSNSLKNVLSQASLRLMGGKFTFAKGRDYFHSERVHSLEIDDDSATTKVTGTKVYECRLEARDTGFTSNVPAVLLKN